MKNEVASPRQNFKNKLGLNASLNTLIWKLIALLANKYVNFLHECP